MLRNLKVQEAAAPSQQEEAPRASNLVSERNEEEAGYDSEAQDHAPIGLLTALQKQAPDAEPRKANDRMLTKKDMVKQLINVTVRKLGENQMKSLQNDKNLYEQKAKREAQLLRENLRQKLANKYGDEDMPETSRASATNTRNGTARISNEATPQADTIASPTSNKSSTLQVLDEAEQRAADLLNAELKKNQEQIDLYRAIKKYPEPRTDVLYHGDNTKFLFYDKAKQLINGTEDNEKRFSDNEVVYFKRCRENIILPIPMLFKHLDHNQILFKGISISLQ